MEERPAIHPADAEDESQLTYGQRLTRSLFPHFAARQDNRECMSCAQPMPPSVIATWSEAGQKEWNISGCCEPCFDRMFAPPLWDLVSELLDNAVENGYLKQCLFSPRLVALDLLLESAEIENYTEEDLIPHIHAWQEAYWL